MLVSELAAPQEIKHCPACEVNGIASMWTPVGNGGYCAGGHQWWIDVDTLYVLGVDDATFARIFARFSRAPA